MSLADFAEFCGHLTLDNGRTMVLEPFQRTMLADYFSGSARETLILLPKANGKSTTVAAVALFELVTTPDAEIVVAAAAREQAGILLRQAAGFVRRSPGLSERLVVKQREIEHRGLGGRVRVLSADADTGDGTLPSLAIIDELHRHRSLDLYAVLRDGLSKRGGRLISISTAGSDADGPLWRTRQAALERGAERNGAYLRAGGDGPLVLHEWSLEPGADPDDLDAVKRANPASAVTLELLRERRESPSMTPWDWRRFACNIFSSAAEPWLPAGAWEACLAPEVEVPDGARVVLAVDIGRKHDSSAIVLCAPVGERVAVRAWIFDSPGEGEESTDLGVIEGKLRDLARRYRVVEVPFDPWSFTRSAQMLADEGLPVIEFPQNNSRMAGASARLLEAIKEGRIAHDGDPRLIAHVMAGATTETERGWRLTKRKARARIDALIALAIALDRSDHYTREASKPRPKYVIDPNEVLREEMETPAERALREREERELEARLVPANEAWW